MSATAERTSLTVYELCLTGLWIFGRNQRHFYLLIFRAFIPIWPFISLCPIPSSFDAPWEVYRELLSKCRTVQ